MNLLDNSLLTVLLTLAATFLGLSLLVQVIQELYKYVRSSKLRAYQNALQDFLGPLAYELRRPGVLSDVRVRGPFQFKRVRPKGMILPLKREELISAIERTAPLWIQRTLNQLKLEVKLQDSNKSEMSNSFKEFLDELGKVEEGTTGYWNALEITNFFHKQILNQSKEFLPDKTNKFVGKLSYEGVIDAKQLLITFSKRFLPHADEASEKHSQFENNFEYTYARSNRRLTFVFAFLIAFFLNYPIDELYKKALETDSATAIKLAESAIELYSKKLDADSLESQDSLLEKKLEMADEIINSVVRKEKSRQNVDYIINQQFVKALLLDVKLLLRYLFGCIVTAVFITFGAPFWNDLASALLRLQKGKTPRSNSSNGERENG